jgi:hypothetical protein
MPPFLKRALRNRWLVTGVHAGLWLLLCLTIAHLGGKAPPYREADEVSNPPQSPVPVAGMEHLFVPGIWPRSLTDTNLFNPFYTTYYVPLAPPPPTTRKALFAYQGFYENAAGDRYAVLKVDDLMMVVPIGAQLTNDTWIANITLPELVLTNAAGQTNTVGLSTNREITIPIK